MWYLLFHCVCVSVCKHIWKKCRYSWKHGIAPVERREIIVKWSNRKYECNDNIFSCRRNLDLKFYIFIHNGTRKNARAPRIYSVEDVWGQRVTCDKRVEAWAVCYQDSWQPERIRTHRRGQREEYKWGKEIGTYLWRKS